MKNKDKYQLYSLDEKEIKKQKLVKLATILTTILFFVLGLTLGLVGLIINGWDIMEFLKNPLLSLGCILCLIIAIFVLGFILFKKGNKDYGGK